MQIKSKIGVLDITIHSTEVTSIPGHFFTIQPEMVKIKKKKLNWIFFANSKGRISTMEKLDLCTGTVCVKHNCSQSHANPLPDFSSAEIRNAFSCHEICWKANYPAEFHWNGEFQRNPGWYLCKQKGISSSGKFATKQFSQSLAFQSQRKFVTSWGLTALLWFDW